MLLEDDIETDELDELDDELIDTEELELLVDTDLVLLEDDVDLVLLLEDDVDLVLNGTTRRNRT